MRTPTAAVALAVATVTIGCANFAFASHRKAAAIISPAVRFDAIRRAQVWQPTDIPSKNIRTGPQGPDAFAPEELVSCEYVDKPLTGSSPKFTCEVADHDQLKVKYGAANGEVYAEVAATRLLWALGFGADRMYPVRIECRGCPPNFRGPRQDHTRVVVEPATVERKMSGRELETSPGSGWEWPELDFVDERAGGAPRAQRDALSLIASLIQHTDSKAEQQRLVCLSKKHEKDEAGGSCARPFMMINDLGQTFGHANRFNRDVPGSVNFEEWSHTPVWADGKRCVANLRRSLTGTLDHPVISEAGRKFLADLLVQLDDRQLYDLFDVARFERRSKHSVEEWVDAFKRKRTEIVDHACPTT